MLSSSLTEMASAEGMESAKAGAMSTDEVTSKELAKAGAMLTEEVTLKESAKAGAMSTEEAIFSTAAEVAILSEGAETPLEGVAISLAGVARTVRLLVLRTVLPTALPMAPGLVPSVLAEAATPGSTLSAEASAAERHTLRQPWASCPSAAGGCRFHSPRCL